MKTHSQPIMPTTADATAREGYAEGNGTPAPESELQARLADTQARLADALNRLSFRDAESAAFAPDGAVPPRRGFLTARVAELEQASERREAEFQELKNIGKARDAELDQKKTKLKALTKSAQQRDAELRDAKAKLKQRDAELRDAKAKLKLREAELREAKAAVRAGVSGGAKLELREAAPKQARPKGLWKVVRGSVLAAGKSLGIAKDDTEQKELRRHSELLGASELFDVSWYLAAYPDVAASGINPVRHYLRHGAAEGRDPGPRFSTSKYLERYPDVVRAGMNPLLHYLKFGLEENRRIFAADENAAVAATATREAPAVPVPQPAAATVPEPGAAPPEPGAVAPEPALDAATVFSLPPTRREEATWHRHDTLCRRPGRTTLELHGTILGWLPTAAPTVGADSARSVPGVGAATLFCRMMRLSDTKALRCFEADAESALPPADVPRAPFGSHLLPSAGQLAPTDVWFASGADLRLRFAKPTPVLRFFQWDLHANKVVLLSEARVQGSNGLTDVPSVNPLLPILIAASDAEGVLEGLYLLPFPSLCRGGHHYGELVAGEGGSLMERLLTLSSSLAETWLTDAHGPFTIGRVDVDLAHARGNEKIFSRTVQQWLESCFDVRCRPVNGSAIADERVRLHLEERLRGANDKAEELSERERSASYVLQLGAGAIPSLQALVARGAAPLGAAGLGASILVDNATGKPQWLFDLARLDAGLVEKQWTTRAPSPRLILLHARPSQAAQPAALHACPRFALALTASSDSAARPAPFGPVTQSDRAPRNPSAQPEISVLCPYWGDERRFAAFLDSLRLQTNVTNLDVIVTATSRRTETGAALEDVVRRFFPDGKIVSCDGRTPPGARLNLMAQHARCNLLLVAAGVLLQDRSTLEVLRRIAEDETAATIGCSLRGVAAAGAAAAARSNCAGFYPDGKEEPQGVVTTFARLDALAPLGGCTYPIAANPPPLFMTSKTSWKELGGFDEALPDMAAVAVDFAVKATKRQYVHLCTSAVTATVIDEAIAVMPKNIPLPSATPPLAWSDVTARSLVVRRLVT